MPFGIAKCLLFPHKIVLMPSVASISNRNQFIVFCINSFNVCSIRDFIFRFISIARCSLLVLLLYIMFYFPFCKYLSSDAIVFFSLFFYKWLWSQYFVWFGCYTFHTDQCRIWLLLYIFCELSVISARFVYTSYKFTVHKTQLTHVCTTELIRRLF